MCISKKILLWNMKREKAAVLYANIGIKDYKRLKEVTRKTKTITHIEEKKGMPFLLYKYRKRKVFFLLLILLLAGLLVSSNYIWNIEVQGESSISKENIIESLQNEGLKIGMPKKKIDTYKIINNVRLNRDDISWIGITIKGTNAIISIKESTKPPEVIKEDEYCNIVADKAGMITKIITQNGTTNVKVR